MLAVAGLTGKNGIMIVEFARERLANRGETVLEAIRHAAEQRFRPILMAALAFGLGVVLSSGAGAGGHEGIGCAAQFGTITGTALAILFVLVTRLFSRGGSSAQPLAQLAE